MTTDEAAPARRPYRSSRREQQAAETREAVLAAAVEMFGTRGWTATGMRDVARGAGVSVETVYAGFRSKSDLLTAVIDRATVGDTAPAPLHERPEFTALGSGTRQQRAQAAARLVSGIHQRNAGVLLALRQAAASDRELARLLRAAEQRRRIDVEQGVSLITGRAVTREECDGLWAVLAVEVYQLVTGLQGWTPRQYEMWLVDVIDRLLRDPGHRT